MFVATACGTSTDTASSATEASTAPSQSTNTTAETAKMASTGTPSSEASQNTPAAGGAMATAGKRPKVPAAGEGAGGAAAERTASTAKTRTKKSSVMLLNRIGPSASELYVANADGSGERKLFDGSGFDYHASFSFDGQWIVFTGERSGAGHGNADIYRVHPDGTGLEQLTDSPALDDQGVLSPDGKQLAFVSSRDTYRANIWILDLETKQLRSLTGAADIQGDPMKPDGFFKPAWSPDGSWIAFSSDRNTEWRGHGDGKGWEHTQELSIYVVHPDGTGLKRLTNGGVCDGSPKWSADGKQLTFHEMSLEDTWNARVFQLSSMGTSQVVTLNVETGERKEVTSGPGLKVEPHILADGSLGYMTKSGKDQAIVYSSGASATFPPNLRSASWSHDDKQVVYERVDYAPRPQNQPLYSWEQDQEYRYTDVFPTFYKDGTLLLTAKDVDSSVVTMKADGTDRKVVYQSTSACAMAGAMLGKTLMNCGASAGVAFQPSWSPDGTRIAFGFGSFLQGRSMAGAKVMVVNRDGSGAQELTSGTPNGGFPSWSADGKEIVYRSWGAGPDEMGLRILNVADRTSRVLTKEPDNVPQWSPDGERILFTRKQGTNFDIYTIKPDGTDLLQLTSFPANDAHAVWTADGKHILWNSGEYGFKDEAALYDHSFQPYGTIWIMKANGEDKRQLTDSHWEDSMPAFVP